MREQVPFFDQIAQLDVVPLLLAVLVGGLIGLEREFHGRPAGVRTHIMVCLTATLLIFASREVPPEFVTNETVRLVLDPNRLGAGIVTGVGFLGAATVIRAGDMVRGITTGATVWSVAGLGVVIGQGEYALALSGAATVILVLGGLDRLTRRIPPVIYRRLIVRGQRSELAGLAERVGKLLSARHIRLQDVSGTRGGADEPFELVFHIRCQNHLQAPEMLELVAAERGVQSVEWSQISH